MRESHLRLYMGLITLPALLLQPSLVGILLQALYCIVLALSSGRKFKIFPNMMLLVSVSAAHLLQPNGLQLFSIGSFVVTLGALLLGARKALVLISLLYISHYMVASRPQFPGKLGQLISMQFYYLNEITSTWSSIHPKRPFIEAIDHLLEQVEKQEYTHVEVAVTHATFGSLMWKLFHIMILWALYIAGTSGWLFSII
jgi:hypothetical protein